MNKPNVIISSNAISSVATVLANPSKERTEEEVRFDKIVAGCVRLRGRHKQKPKPTGKHVGRAKRLYTVTTLAASSRFGGRRTVAIYDSFDQAVELVTGNHGDIYEYSYKLCVIEGVLCNRLYGTLNEAYWFKWYGTVSKDSWEHSRYDGYKAIRTPKEYEGICGHGIG